VNAAAEYSPSWREVAIKFFPERAHLYAEPAETLWSVLFDLHDAVLAAHRNGDQEALARIYAFAAWCHAQKDADPQLWTAASAAFYEHLVDNPLTYREIPRRLSPEICAGMIPEFKDRLDNKERYPDDDAGSFAALARRFDEVHGTGFSSAEDMV
jgi:hypothetical protein